MRQRMKALQLGINYGMSVPSLAKGLNRHPMIGCHIIETYCRRYPRYWQWKEERADAAMHERKMELVFGWPMYLSNSPNRRTLYNFPMQSGGAAHAAAGCSAAVRDRHRAVNVSARRSSA